MLNSDCDCVLDQGRYELYQKISRKQLKSIFSNVSNQILSVLNSSVTSPSKREITAIEAETYLKSCITHIDKYLVEMASHYSAYQWLWYFRRLPPVYGGSLKTTSPYCNMLAEIISGTSHKISNDRWTNSSSTTFPTDDLIVKRILKFVAAIQMLHYYHVLVRWAGKGAIIKIKRFSLPIAIHTSEIEAAVNLYDKRAEKSVLFDYWFNSSGTVLSSIPKKEEFIGSFLLVSSLQIPENVHINFNERKCEIKAFFSPIPMQLARIKELLLDRRLKGESIFSVHLGSLLALLRSSMICFLIMTEVKWSLFNVGYYTMKEDAFKAQVDLCLHACREDLAEFSINMYLPSTAEELLSQLTGMSGQPFPLIPGPILRRDGTVVCVDVLAAAELLQKLLVFPALGSAVNARAEDFELMTQSTIDKSPWAPDLKVAAIRRRTLRLNGKDITDIDAIGVKDDTLLIVSCKSITYTLDYDAGDYRSVRNIASNIEESVRYWKNIQDILRKNPIGNNYDISGYKNIFAIVCTPNLFYVPIGIATENQDAGLLNYCSLNELHCYLDGQHDD